MVSKKIEVTTSKIGLPTLQIEDGSKKILLHSKYDPLQEAEQIINKYENQIDDYHHVLFYGVGLGYHVKNFITRYPEKLVSTYEPIVEVGDACNSMEKATQFPASLLKFSFLEKEEADIEGHLNTLANQLSQKVLVIVLPTYERFLKKEIMQFLNKFKEIVTDKQINLKTNEVFSKRWAINSLRNLPSTFENPDFLISHAELFKDKPIILVAAGPSLSEEIEHLRKIKEEGLAYIFAVGSANKALLAKGIYPDAVFTYDPQSHNHSVFQPIIKENITTIPMIYGTSVGFETINRYPGPKFYFVTSQDTVTQHFHKNQLPVVNDAYSIAIVAMEILYHLQVSKIILVGQNFAFKNDLFYSKEIQRYDKEKQELSDAGVQQQDLEDQFYVTDVDGNTILTNKRFDNMRRWMEKYISQNPKTPVYNTTRGGAAIEGTVFISLSRVVEEQLVESVVSKDWYIKENISSSPAQQREENAIKALEKDITNYRDQDSVLFKHFEEVRRKIDRFNQIQLQKTFAKTDVLVRRITSNLLYQIAIRPITRNEYERLQSEAELLRKKEPSKEKLRAVIESFTSYFDSCREVYKEIVPIICNITLIDTTQSNIEKIVDNSVFHFEGQWEKIAHYTQDTEEAPRTVHVRALETKSKHAKIAFRFEGTALRLIGTNHSEIPLKLRVHIDDKVWNTSINKSIAKEQYGSFIRHKLVEIDNLNKESHNICIEILSENPHLLIQRIELDPNEKVYHIDEVNSFSELSVGQRIRCCIERSSGDGTAKVIQNDNNLPRHSKDNEEIFLVKVHENEDGSSKFICNESKGLVWLDLHGESIKLNAITNTDSDDRKIGNASCSSYFGNQNSQWTADKAFNKKVDGFRNAWATELGVTNGWIKFDFESPTRLNCYTMTNQPAYSDVKTIKRMPMNWEFQALTNHGDWIVLDEKAEITDWIDKEKKHFIFKNEESYKSYRLVVEKNNGDPDFLAIGEIEMI